MNRLNFFGSLKTGVANGNRIDSSRFSSESPVDKHFNHDEHFWPFVLAQFEGKPVHRWDPRTGQGGVFYITRLQRLDGSWEQVGRSVDLYPTAPQ